MDPLPGLIAHHPQGATLVVEVAIVAALAAGFGTLWLRERRRRRDRERPIARMRS